MPTGGENVVAALRELGVDVAFGLPGVHNLAIWRAFPGSGVRLVGVRHEQTAGYAGDGWARATGRLGVAITTTGPGAANVVAATGEAWAAHSPLLVLATDIPTSQRVPGNYRGVLHETTDQPGFFRPVTKAVVRVESADEVFAEVVAAGRLALQHPRRPVYVEIPTDLLSAQAAAPEPMPALRPAVWTEVVLDDVVHLLGAAERPLLWAGGGATASDAAPLVREVARRLGAPVLTSYGGRGLLPPDAPELVPLPPHEPAAGELWDSADLVVVLGSDLDAMNTQGFRQPRPPRLVTVDLAEPTTYPPDVWVRADVAEALTPLVEALPELGRRPWWERPQRHLDGPESTLLAALEQALPDDGVVVADMCVAGYWYGGYGAVARPRGLAYPVGWGTLGFGFPAALGTALSGRPTVALVGDGGFLFACGDLATAAQERLPLTVVIVDDGGYGMLAYDFRKDGQQPIGCQLEPPDFVALAESFRVPAERVELPDLRNALPRHLALDGPSVIVLPLELTPPPNTSPRWYRAQQSRS